MATTNDAELASSPAMKMGFMFISRLNHAMVTAPNGISKKLADCTRITSATPGER